MYYPWKFARDQVNKRTNTEDNDESCTPSITATAAQILQSYMIEHIKEQVKIKIIIMIIRVNYMNGLCGIYQIIVFGPKVFLLH